MYHPTKDTIDILFEACLTYEPGQMEPIDFLEGNSKSNDFSGSVVWILGKDHFLPKCKFFLENFGLDVPFIVNRY